MLGGSSAQYENSCVASPRLRMPRLYSMAILFICQSAIFSSLV